MHIDKDKQRNVKVLLKIQLYIHAIHVFIVNAAV